MELTLDQALQKGIEAHKAGKTQEADRYYTAILKANPKHPDANHNMGVLAVGIGKIEAALPFFKTALEVKPEVAQYSLSYIQALLKIDQTDDAKKVLEQAKSKGITHKSLDKLERQIGSSNSINLNAREPSQEQLKSLINLHSQARYKEAKAETLQLLKHFSHSVTLHNILGAANRGLGKFDEAIEAYKKALSIKPDYAESYYNLGNAFMEQGRLEKAIKAYNKALSIKPDYALAYYNLGNARKEGGELNKSIDAYKKAISFKPDFADAHNNIGNALKEKGFLAQAMKAYNKALSIKPDYTEVHYNISTIESYTRNKPQIEQVKHLIKNIELSEEEMCYLEFTLAKMYEDIGELEQAFNHLSRGNSLRKKLLNYYIGKDEKLFFNLRETQKKVFENRLNINEFSVDSVPIFILGMPRSGTTLVEQIISSHSKVTGAGELRYVAQHGFDLATGSRPINTSSLFKFREKYLSELAKVSNGNVYVTDKMPQNFRFIALICAALPEAKIIHTIRDPRATCWSNFKQIFASEGLGYCYDLGDVVSYYKLYDDLMKFWQPSYSDKIYNLDYEKLTTDQNYETKKLLEYLELEWEEECLAPHKNKRSVRTASQQQVRQKVYQGSSEAWRKYEPFLGAAFEGLPLKL